MTRVNQPPPSEAIADFFNGIRAFLTYPVQPTTAE
jgi:hypothetical protein